MESKDHSILIEQLKKGSRDAFTSIYMIYSNRVYAFALKLTKSPSDAEDILQEAFTIIWVNRENISTDLSFKSYLFKISYNLIIDCLRKRIFSVDFENFIISEYYQNTYTNETDAKINFDDYRRLLKRFLMRLSPRQQEIFHLSRNEGMSAKKIGEKLGISEKTVNNQLSLILTMLKKVMFISIVLLYLLTLLSQRNQKTFLRYVKFNYLNTTFKKKTHLNSEIFKF